MTTKSKSKPRRRNSCDNGFIEIRRNGRLLFRYDPNRDLVEIKPKGSQSEVVDLRQYRAVVRDRN